MKFSTRTKEAVWFVIGILIVFICGITNDIVWLAVVGGVLLFFVSIYFADLVWGDYKIHMNKVNSAREKRIAQQTARLLSEKSATTIDSTKQLGGPPPKPQKTDYEKWVEAKAVKIVRYQASYADWVNTSRKFLDPDDPFKVHGFKATKAETRRFVSSAKFLIDNLQWAKENEDLVKIDVSSLEKSVAHSCYLYDAYVLEKEE